MSSFSNTGRREKIRGEKRMVKRHMKAMYSILDEVKLLAKEIHDSEVEWSEETIEEVAAQFTDREIASMEKFLLLGNLQMLKDEAVADNNK